ncbi:hypothetical protein M3Y98_00218700 [Aphelenchoides besseyi]|nr:hypothetical protein M3Y98_00218700 [Aphelenchoides besseyi]KAI6200458.1 hypothetical protein M3Y96_00736200 [Aphelenchoides besseyi]
MQIEVLNSHTRFEVRSKETKKSPIRHLKITEIQIKGIVNILGSILHLLHSGATNSVASRASCCRTSQSLTVSLEREAEAQVQLEAEVRSLKQNLQRREQGWCTILLGLATETAMICF